MQLHENAVSTMLMSAHASVTYANCTILACIYSYSANSVPKLFMTVIIISS